MPALTTSKTTPKPPANGRYKTKTEWTTAILLDRGTDLPYAEFRQEYKVRYGEDPGANDTTFYRVRSKLRLRTLDLASPNIAERPSPIVSTSKASNGIGMKAEGQPTVATDGTWTASTEIPGGMAFVAVTKAPEGSKPLRRPTWADEPVEQASKAQMIRLAMSMGGLLALRRAVDELIGGLAPELREGAKL